MGSISSFGCATPAPVEKDAEEIPEDEKVNVDLWHWKDDFISRCRKCVRRGREGADVPAA